MDNFRVIYRILRYLEKALDYDEPNMDCISAKALKLSDQRWMALMEMLSKEGYIDGFSVQRTVDGSILISSSTVILEKTVLTFAIRSEASSWR